MTWLAAAQAANDALNELGIDTTQAVDPFEAIDRLPLLLAFRPLEHLLGAILPGDPAGVLINSERPVALQRYTAAHELGHWYLHQDSLQLDTVETIEGRRSSRRELDAQTFAAHFLMPLDLVHATARKYGVGPGRDPLPSDVYQVARDMRVSFEAAIRHLANCKLISSTSRDKLLRLRPIAVKRELTAGAALADARGDVWLVDESQDGLALEVFVGDTILLRLASIFHGEGWLAGSGSSAAGWA